MTEPFRFSRRARKWFLVTVLAYPVALILLGPFYALDGRGYLNFVPEGVRNVFYLPALPFYLTMGPRNPYDDYLSWWYEDPNAAETTW
ncbi:MAG: hypothetical protein JWR26_220 [Pedosphaera sp.]|nr:hypothetical protein [Pedosphaera sp.]